MGLIRASRLSQKPAYRNEAGMRYMRICLVSGLTVAIVCQTSTYRLHYSATLLLKIYQGYDKTYQSMRHAFVRLAQAVGCTLGWCLYSKIVFLNITLSSALHLPDLPSQLSSDPSLLPATFRNLTTHINHPSSTWPPTPFIIRNIKNDSDHPAWMRVINTGQGFALEESTYIDWATHILLVRLLELDRDDPCPDYEAVSSQTMLKLDVRPLHPPTAALCAVAIELFEQLVQKWGTREVLFSFGKGTQITMQQGSFTITRRRPPRDPGMGQS